jgi:N-acyl-phosphatidylethanolamine-hydrolysing phospholipase D
MMKASHLNPEEAVRAALDLESRAALGIHYGTFDLSDEPLGEPPGRFRAAAARSALGADGAWVLRIGEVREF